MNEPIQILMLGLDLPDLVTSPYGPFVEQPIQSLDELGPALSQQHFDVVVLATEPLIRYDRQQWGGRQADQYLRQAGIVPRERFELNALNAIAVMVDRGLGVSLVPDWMRPWPEGLDLVRLPLPGKFEPRRMGIVWSRSTATRRAAPWWWRRTRW
mgnify:CR=1 FL=1